MSSSPIAARVGWGLVGLLGVFAGLALLTIGVFVLPVALVLAGVLLLRYGADRAAAGALLVGAAAPVGWIAWLNRFGPGTYCRTTADGVGCTQMWSPWPWFAVAVILVVAGVAVAVRRPAH